jgi:hypothetical protein
MDWLHILLMAALPEGANSLHYGMGPWKTTESERTNSPEAQNHGNPQPRLKRWWPACDDFGGGPDPGLPGSNSSDQRC